MPTTRTLHAALTLTLPILLAACGGTPPQETAGPGGAAPAGPSQTVPWAIRIEPMSLPVGASSTFSQLTTSARGTILSWVELGDTDPTMKFAERTDAGWSAATTVGSSPNWFLSGADVPSVLRLSNGTLVAHTYPATAPEEEAYDLQLLYSKDEGKTWSRPLSPHHDKTRTQHGFATLFELPTKGLGLVWLDGRADKTPGDGSGMGLYYTSFDESWKQTAETRINDRVCECCQTSAVVTDLGVLAAFRDRSPEEVRDVHVSRLDAGGWTRPRAVFADNWKIEACPVNGPAISARDRHVAAAWFTAVNDEPHAFIAFSGNAGDTWTTPVRLDDVSTLGHVDVELLDDGSAVATWVEFAEQTARLKVRRVEPAGAKSPAIEVTDTRVTGYPHIARRGDELVFVWTEVGDSGEQTKGAAARILR